MSIIHNNKILKDRRVELRKNSTDFEQKLWKEIRNNKLGVKFRRQHSIGDYIADFYCYTSKLVIELDGEIHNIKENQEYDEARDKFIKELGFKTIRFYNSDIKNNMNDVIQKIKESI